MFKQSDIEQLKAKGISESTIIQQIERFKKNFPPVKADRPATINDGIISLPSHVIDHYINIFNREREDNLKLMKFVPASGAATRMFKDLFQYLDQPEPIINLADNHPVRQFIDNLHDFAFFSRLEELFPNHNLKKHEVRRELANEIIQKVLHKEGLGYGFLPKGLILFHKNGNLSNTSMAEHLYEGAMYSKDKDGVARIHFTISPEHLDFFREQVKKDQSIAKQATNTSFEISFSFQKPHTDTIAVTPQNEPFRDRHGQLLFRPGGHGALIENLNDCDADIIFIKNIDNVVPASLLPVIVNYKQALGGLALEIRNRVFQYLRQLEEKISDELIVSARKFLNDFLHTDIPLQQQTASIEEQAAYLYQYFNRPIRVCGMVKNQGEPGGGPFWVKDASGQQTLQIVEGSQFNLKDPDQKEVFEASTHFNPVDLVCITQNYKGEKFDLLQYIDPETGFISLKHFQGKTIKALELPGLWNGAMARWLTIFVEVPIETFNPVKTVTDLLRPAHQQE
ncbi:DUF4301 family protein [Thermophagus sp. OGC60D27]|uniref:DUF4301 family protein n=1 Tax=Thermophagus sp. OGC60D27 TaxID=3458415 RepID=UPI00403823F2